MPQLTLIPFYMFHRDKGYVEFIGTGSHDQFFKARRNRDAR